MQISYLLQTANTVLDYEFQKKFFVKQPIKAISNTWHANLACSLLKYKFLLHQLFVKNTLYVQTINLTIYCVKSRELATIEHCKLRYYTP